MEYIKENKPCIDGIPLEYICHLQDVCESGMVYPAHYHDYIEVLFGKENDFEIYLGNSYHRFGPGDLVLIPSGEIHLINSLSPAGGSYYVIRFLPDLIYNGITYSRLKFQYLLPFLARYPHQEQVISHEVLKDTSVSFWVKEILREDEEKNYGFELAVRNHIGNVFLWILRYWHKQGIVLPSDFMANEELAEQLEPAFSYVREHFDTSVKASHAAKLCGMSYSYFSRNFNRILHMSFSDYVTRIRLAEAEKLLVSTTSAVTEIAVAHE